MRERERDDLKDDSSKISKSGRLAAERGRRIL